jgi:hypothetical protein
MYEREGWARVLSIALTVAIVMVGVGAVPTALVRVLNAHATLGGTQTFTTPGCSNYTVPANVTLVQVDAYGAQGEGINAVLGGSGGHAAGLLTVAPNQVLDVCVGGHGGPAGAGGFNGGGNSPLGGDHGGGGGGASDVRVNGSTVANRVIVAGGGGGAGGFNAGGTGGGVAGGNGDDGLPAVSPGQGATQTGPGAGGAGGTLGDPCSGGVVYTAGGDGDPGGAVGVGGDGGTGVRNENVCTIGPELLSGAGGGGGYHGGGGGSGHLDAAGGGSGYVDPSVFAGVNETSTHTGNGEVDITPTSPGCGVMNLFAAVFDAAYEVQGGTIGPFNAGDHIVMTAGAPATGTPTTVSLSVGNVAVDSTPFPGTVEYTVPASNSVIHMFWRVLPTPATATWTVSCTPGPAPTDTTAPNVTIGFTSPSASPNGTNDWYKTSPVKGTVSANDTTTGNSNITSIDCTGVTLTNPQGIGTSPTASKDFSISTDGTTNISCTATDALNNTSSPATTATVKLDATKPSLSPSVTPNSVLLGGTAPTASAGATDATSGVASSSCNNGQPLDTSTVGSHTVTCTATDNAGNTNTGTATYVVGVGVSKLSPPAKTQFKAGSTIPTKFQLTGANGQPITATLAAQLSSACAVKVAFDAQPAVCAVYDPTQNFFQANLNTPKNLAVGTVVPITITVKVGTTTIGTGPPLSILVTK